MPGRLSSSYSRVLGTAAKTVLCAGLVWFLLQQPPPAIIKALFYAFFAWGCATAIVACLYFATSLDDFRDVLFASLSTSSAAMWLVPAILLLSMRIPAAVAVALLLIANTMRLLFAIRPPQERSLAEVPLRRHGGAPLLFHTAAPPTFMRETLPVILGAVALQVGAGLAWAGRPLAASGLIATGAAVLTWSSVARGAYWRKDKPSTRFSLLSILLTLLLATVLSVGQVAADSESANVAGFIATTSRIVNDLARPADPKHPPKPSIALLARPVPKVKKFTPAANQVTGVILRPDTKPREKAVALRPSGTTLALPGPVTFPFTGEYHLFPSSSGGAQRDSVVHRGTPLDFLYASASGGPVETEAYQPLDPPFDFSVCAKILLNISSGEVTPSSASMYLEIAGQLVEIGIGVFGLEPASDETLEFELPPLQRSLKASAIRVIFRRDPAARDQTTKVAIQRFTLVPR